jgi:anti-sigma regulatory factor (Ser/Thr protein kinase)
MTGAYCYDTRTVPGWQHALWDRPALAELRGEVKHALASRMGRAKLDDVLLVLTELVSNSYCHTNAPSRAEVTVTGGGVRVEVSDMNTKDLRLRPLAPTRPHGRGLALVNEVSDDWGVESTRDGHGKTVWAVL